MGTHRSAGLHLIVEWYSVSSFHPYSMAITYLRERWTSGHPPYHICQRIVAFGEPPKELCVFVKYLKPERKLQNLQILYILRSFLSVLAKTITNVLIFYLQRFVQFLYQFMYHCWWFFLSRISMWNVSKDSLCVMDGLLLAGQQQVVHHQTITVRLDVWHTSQRCQHVLVLTPVYGFRVKVEMK